MNALAGVTCVNKYASTMSGAIVVIVLLDIDYIIMALTVKVSK